jgi:diaminopimelate epimerase
MQTSFIKMHGAGNDFAVFDARATRFVLSPRLAAAIADRRRGIGCDQVIVLEAADAPADAFMRIRNPDGSEAGACGNATRCVATLLSRETGRTRQIIRTIAGLLPAECLADGRIQVDMGPALLDWRDLALAHAADTLHLPLAGDPAGAAIGNPHATFFVADLAVTDVAGLGRRYETDTLFTARANIGFAEITGPGRMRLRVWERGAGLTLACGSGACAALVNAHRRGLVGREAEVVVDGGVLHIAWREDGHVLMTGPVAEVYRGSIDLAALEAAA